MAAASSTQLVIEQRRPRLEAVCHRRDVDLRNQVAREVGRGIDLQHDVDDVSAGRCRPGGAIASGADGSCGGIAGVVQGARASTSKISTCLA